MHDAMTERTHTITMKPITMLASATMPDWITCDPTSATTAEIASSAELGKMSNIDPTICTRPMTIPMSRTAKLVLLERPAKTSSLLERPYS